MNQKALIGYVLQFLSAHGVRSCEIRECGCWTFQFGRTLTQYCSMQHEEEARLRKHPNAVPRKCRCGKCQRLTAITSYYHRQGDDVRVDEFRQERINHYKECDWNETEKRSNLA